LEWLHGRRVVSLSSLGNPENFERTLRDLGVADLVSRRFPDHYNYSTQEARAALLLSPELSAVITTAKDAPKLRHALSADADRADLRSVYLLDVDLEITRGESELSRRVLDLIETGHRATCINAFSS
jgi:tetraacyldisaccharide 4'-kinase